MKMAICFLLDAFGVTATALIIVNRWDVNVERRSITYLPSSSCPLAGISRRLTQPVPDGVSWSQQHRHGGARLSFSVVFDAPIFLGERCLGG
jgi:hypothetical protein